MEEERLKKQKQDLFDKISITKIKLLEFILYVTEKKLQKFLKLDPDLCNVPLKHENGQILEIKSLKMVAKRLIKKNIFVKSLLRDAWVVTRLRVYYLFKLANVHMERVDLDKYAECIKEAEKEILNRMKTHEDEEAHVFNVLLKIEELKQHVRNHDLDGLISEYERIKESMRKIKTTDFGYLLNFRINAGLGYAAKLAQNDIVLPQRFHQAIQIYTYHYEEKRQVTYVDENDRFVYYFSQLQICKYMQRNDQINEAIELAERMQNRLQKKKLKIKVKDHLIKEFHHFLQACLSFLQCEESPRIFDCKKAMKKKKEIIIQSLFNFSEDQEENEEDFVTEENRPQILYEANYEAKGRLSQYLNTLQMKKEYQQMGIFGYTQEENNVHKNSSYFENLFTRFESLKKQNENQNEEQIVSHNIKTEGDQRIMYSENEQHQSQKANSQNEEAIKQQKEQYPQHKRVHTDGEVIENKTEKGNDGIFDYFGKGSRGGVTNSSMKKSLFQTVSSISSQTDRMIKLQKIKDPDNESLHMKKMKLLNHHRFSLSINPNEQKNAFIDELFQKQEVSSTRNIGQIQSGMIIHDFISKKRPSITITKRLDTDQSNPPSKQNIISRQNSSQVSRQDILFREIQQQGDHRIESSSQINGHKSAIKHERKESENKIDHNETVTTPLEFQTLQNKFSVTIEKETPLNSGAAPESQLEYFKSHFFRSNSSNNIKQHTQSLEPEEEEDEDQEQEDNTSKHNQVKINSEQNSDLDHPIFFNPYGLVSTQQKDNIKGYHKKSKTLQQFQSISQFIDLQSQKNSDGNKGSIKITVNNKSNQNESTQQNGNINKSIQNEQVKVSLNRKNSLPQTKDSSQRNLNNVGCSTSVTTITHQMNNFMTENSLSSQTRTINNNSQSQPKLKILIPSEVDKFHLAPSFNQMKGQKGHRKYKSTVQSTISNQSPNKSQIAHTQFSSNVNFQNVTKETNQSNYRAFETLNTEHSTLSNMNNNQSSNSNQFQHLFAMPNQNNGISRSGNKTRKISLMSSNKTYTFPNQTEAVKEDYLLENDDDQIKFQQPSNKMNNISSSQQQLLYSNQQQYQQNQYQESLPKKQQRLSHTQQFDNQTQNSQRTISQSSFDEKTSSFFSSIFNNLSKRNQSRSSINFQMKKQNLENLVKPQETNQQENLIQDMEQQQINAAQNTDAPTQETDNDEMRQSLSICESGQHKKETINEKQANKMKNYFQKQQQQNFDKSEKFGSLQLYLNKMLYVDPYDYLPKPSTREIFSNMMKFNYQKNNSTSMASSTPINYGEGDQSEQQQSEFQQPQLQHHQQNHSGYSSTTHRKHQSIGSSQDAEIRKVALSIPVQRIYANNRQSLDFQPLKQSIQPSPQVATTSHMHTQTLSTNFERMNKLNNNRSSFMTKANIKDGKEEPKNMPFKINTNDQKLKIANSSEDEGDSVQLRTSIMAQIQKAKQEINNEQFNNQFSKQQTLFSLESLKLEQQSSSASSKRKATIQSRFAPNNIAKPSTFKKQIITKNSFDSDSFEEVEPILQSPSPPKKLLRRAKAFEAPEEDEEEIGSQQQPSQRNPIISPSSASNMKSMNSIAFMLVGKKHWFNVNHKEMTISERIARSNHAKDELSQTIFQLNLKFPVFSFCSYRIGRYQNWKVRYVDYYQSNKCFQINFLGADNLFYKMFIPARSQKDFSYDSSKFVTIWPIVLEYLIEYMESKKIVLKFTDDINLENKFFIKDFGINKYFQENKQESELSKIVSKIVHYKNRSQHIDVNDSQEFIQENRREDDIADDEEDESEGEELLGEDGTKKKKQQGVFKFFLGLARKNSYFPTIRDAIAAAKIKKIFEILLYRYMYDQLRPTGKKLILKKDASTMKYKNLSKKIQKLENDLEKTTTNLRLKKGPPVNFVDHLISNKFGTMQLRKLVQKDLMKIPDKQEYQIEQIWKLRYRENPYQLCSFILKTKEKSYYLVSLNLIFKKEHNALLQMFLKKSNEYNKGLKEQFDKIIQVQLLYKPKQEKNIEQQIKEQQEKEQKILQMIELQQMQESTPHQRTAVKRDSLTKLSTISSTNRLQSSQNIPLIQSIQSQVNITKSKDQITQKKKFSEDDFKEILTQFDLNLIIKGIVINQKIPKNFKNLCIKNLKRRVVITEEQLFLRLDKIDIIRRKMNQHPPIIVQTDIPDATDPRMKDFLMKQSPFIGLYDYAYQKAELRTEKINTKHHYDQNSDLTDDDSDIEFNGLFGGNNVQYIQEVQEDFEKIEKAEKANNYYFEELHFKCSCHLKQNINSIYLKYTNMNNLYYMKVTMHGSEHTENDHFTENIHAHLDITITCPKLRFRKTYSTSKRKALLLFNSFKKIKYKNAFDPPIYLVKRKRIELDFEINIQRVSRRKTIGEILQRTEVKRKNLSELPAIEILKIALLKNVSQMESLRSHKRFSVVDSINSFGRVVVTMIIFYDHINGKYYSLEFQDFTSKSRMYRIALNDNDLEDLFGLRLFSDDTGDTIIKIIRRICYHVRFEQQNFYRVPFLYFREEQYRKGLQLNKRNVIEKLRKNEFYGNYRRFYNKVVKYTFEKENLNKNKKVYLIDAQRKNSRIIFHKVFFHQNEYFVLTLKKSLFLQQFWMLIIYVPKTGRRIMGYIQSKDLEQIQFQNLNRDLGLFEIYDQDQPFKSYIDFVTAVQNHEIKKSPRTNQKAKNTYLREFTRKISYKLKPQNSINLEKSNEGSICPSSPDFVKFDDDKSIDIDHLNLPSEDEPVKQLISPRITPRPITDQPKVIIPQKMIQRHEKRYGTHIQFNSNQEEQTDTQMKIVLEEKFHQITAQISKAYKQSYVLSYRLSNLSSFVEMKIWDDITNNMQLKHKGQQYVMQMGNISVPMQEFINSSQIQTDQGPEIFVEYFIGKQHNHGEYLVTQNFEEISYPASLHYYIYLRFYYFNQLGIMHKKINLRELLNLFIADGYYKYQTNYMHSKLQLQDLVQLCDFVSYKLKTGTYGSILNQNQFQFKRTGLESYSRKTLQTLVKEQEQEEGENGISEKFVFQAQPYYSIVKVFIKRANRIVEFLIYTPKTNQTFKKSYNMSEIALSIPFINQYLKAGLFRPLAKNILILLHKELSFHLKNFYKEKQNSNI